MDAGASLGLLLGERVEAAPRHRAARFARRFCRGRSQYGDLHLGLGQTFGGAFCRGNHSWPQRVHCQNVSVTVRVMRGMVDPVPRRLRSIYRLQYTLPS